MFSLKKTIYSLFFTVIGVFALYSIANAQSVAIPSVNYMTSGADKTFANFSVAGSTATNTEVLIYVDGSFSGTAMIQGEDTLEPRFLFVQEERLEAGDHTFMVIARDKTSLVLSPPTKEYAFSVKRLTPSPEPSPSHSDSIPAPVLFAPNESTVTASVKPLITGVVKSDIFVHVYIDGVYNGKTSFLSDDSGTADFAYKPFLNLEPGEHFVWAVADDGKGLKSRQSNILSFNIEEPMPAPVVIKTVASGDTNRPAVTGVAKNGSVVKVFIDKKLDGEFRVKDNRSGTASFSYKPFTALTYGKHIVYATAVDSRGKESAWSNIFSFETAKPVQPKISAAYESADEEGEYEEDYSAEEEYEKKEGKEPGDSGSKEGNKEGSEEKPVDSGAETKKEDAGGKSGVDSILEELGIKPDEEATTSGLVDEQQNQQSSTKLNLIIFLVFLFGVIAWIFWVNRELIRERQENAELETENKDKENTSDSASNPDKF